MVDEFPSDLKRDFQRKLSQAKAADSPTEKLDCFMDAYAVFQDIHEAVSFPLPRDGDGNPLTAESLRALTTDDDDGTQFNEEAFIRHTQMLAEKIRMLEEMTCGPRYL